MSRRSRIPGPRSFYNRSRENVDYFADSMPVFSGNTYAARPVYVRNARGRVDTGVQYGPFISPRIHRMVMEREHAIRVAALARQRMQRRVAMNPRRQIAARQFGDPFLSRSIAQHYDRLTRAAALKKASEVIMDVEPGTDAAVTVSNPEVAVVAAAVAAPSNMPIVPTGLGADFDFPEPEPQAQRVALVNN